MTPIHAQRTAALEIPANRFREIGHRLVDRIAEFLDSLPDQKVSPGMSPETVRAALGFKKPLPLNGSDPDQLLQETFDLMVQHSLFNGHPGFWGYITSSAAPIGALADLLAASINPNLGGWALSPMATEIEAQTVRWIAEMIGYPVDCGGTLVSGGNLANMTAFWTARRAMAPWDVRSQGLGPDRPRLRAYASTETHTWIEKAADLSGMGTGAVRWIQTDEAQRIDLNALRTQVEADRRAGDFPFLVVGTAGTVSTGAIDPLPALAEICEAEHLWFHVDGAYGAFAAALPEAPEAIAGLRQADSVALDPHKWLYAPLEAGCVLVREKKALRDTFVFHPPYYPEEDQDPDAPIFYHEYGLQNSRGFRALKVWLALRQAGLNGYRQMIADDVDLARELFEAVTAHPDLEAFTQNLSITTFRYHPPGWGATSSEGSEEINALNQKILEVLQERGQVYLSQAMVDGKFCLRACVVNFRTSAAHMRALPDLVAEAGRELADRID